MQNRFGIKDFFLFALILVLVVMVGLSMWQYDRQWNELQTIKQRNTEMTGEVAQIARDVRRLSTQRPAVQAPPAGVAPGDTPPQQGPALTAGVGRDGTSDPFYLLEEAEQMEGFARGGWFVDNFGTRIGRLTPLVSTDVYQRWVEYQVAEPLASRDPFTLEYLPVLAEGWEESDDGLVYTFHMRPEAVFSDGRPVTAHDVVFTFDWIRNPEVNAPRQRAYLTTLEGVEALDDHTVRFTFNEPYYLNFDTAAGSIVLPKHFYEQFSPSEFNDSIGLLMGSGPYRLENPRTWSPGDGVTLVRNERFWGTPGTYDRLVFREVENDAASMVMYGNGEFDVLRCTPEMFRQVTQDTRVMSFSDAKTYTSVFGGYTYVGWNQQRIRGGQTVPTLFADARVRRAMTMLVDRERIVQDIFLGYGQVASGPFAPNGPQAAPDVSPWPFDLDAAVELLTQAGFTRRGNTMLDPEGNPFRFTLTYPSGNETTERVVRQMRDGLARAGIRMDTDDVLWPVLIQKLDRGDFDAITLGWSSSIESDPYQIFHSDQIRDGGDNRTGYSNPELDRLIDEARRTTDTTARMELWNQVHRILHQDQPYTFLVNRQALRLTNNRVRNVTESKMGLNYENLNGGVMPWFTPREQQRLAQ